MNHRIELQATTVRLVGIDGSPPDAPPARPVAVHLSSDLRLSAASRLVSEASGNRQTAARRFISAAPLHGIDLDLLWGTVDRRSDGTPERVREACLAVVGSGRTAMLFLSGPEHPGMTRGDASGAERVAAIRCAVDHFIAADPARVRLIQALPEPHETWAIEAFLDAGFQVVGDLAYLRRPLERRPKPASPGPLAPTWPEGVSVRQVTRLGDGAADQALLIAALERSYEETLDCPELCGLRQTRDVLASHRSTGAWDPSLWWIVFLHDEPHGCMLFNLCPEQQSVELVYLGLSPAARGRRIGSKLLAMGLEHLRGQPATEVACAVDRRNTPALRLYESAGFREFTGRVALVKPV